MAIQRTSTINIDYDKLINKMYDLKDKKYPHLNFSDFCRLYGITDAGIYVAKRTGKIGSKLIRGLKLMKIKVNDILCTNKYAGLEREQNRKKLKKDLIFENKSV